MLDVEIVLFDFGIQLLVREKVIRVDIRQSKDNINIILAQL